jgi:hypothetical protein
MKKVILSCKKAFVAEEQKKKRRRVIDVIDGGW